MLWTFAVDGPLVGHKCSKSKCFSKPVVAFKNLVRWTANLAGVPQELDPNGCYSLRTEISWVKKAKTDSDNIHKLLKDGLWGKDRRVLAGGYSATEYAGVERVTVTVEGEADGRRNSRRVRTRR